MKRTHATMNLITGEVITSTSAKGLKRSVFYANKYPISDNTNYKRQWLFAHGEDWQDKLRKKYLRILSKNLLTNSN